MWWTFPWQTCGRRAARGRTDLKAVSRDLHACHGLLETFGYLCCHDCGWAQEQRREYELSDPDAKKKYVMQEA